MCLWETNGNDDSSAPMDIICCTLLKSARYSHDNPPAVAGKCIPLWNVDAVAALVIAAAAAAPGAS